MITITKEEAEVSIRCIRIVMDKYDRDYNNVCDSLEKKFKSEL